MGEREIKIGGHAVSNRTGPRLRQWRCSDPDEHPRARHRTPASHAGEGDRSSAIAAGWAWCAGGRSLSTVGATARAITTRSPTLWPWQRALAGLRAGWTCARNLQSAAPQRSRGGAAYVSPNVGRPLWGSKTAAASDRYGSDLAVGGLRLWDGVKTSGTTDHRSVIQNNRVICERNDQIAPVDTRLFAIYLIAISL